jgi:hypothetical protein
MNMLWTRAVLFACVGLVVAGRARRPADPGIELADWLRIAAGVAIRESSELRHLMRDVGATLISASMPAAPPPWAN